MGISTDIAHNSFEFEDSGNFTFQCSTSYEDENCSSPDSVFEYTFPTVSENIINIYIDYPSITIYYRKVFF